MHNPIEVLGLVLAGLFVAYWFGSLPLLHGIARLQQAAIDHALDGHPVPRLLAFIVRSPIIGLVYRQSYPRMRMEVKMRRLVTTESTRQLTTFSELFDTSPFCHDLKTQLDIEYGLTKLAVDVSIWDDAIIHSSSGELDNTLYQIHAMVAELRFNQARDAAVYFGHEVMPSWHAYIDHLNTFQASAA
jgi:hypothetical protein